MKEFIIPLVLLCLSLNLSAAKKPNVVILYADDMGVGDVSYGDKNAKIITPNLDRLAAAGMTFTDGHSSSGICTPSRFAMLTGQHHWRRFHNIVGPFGKTVFKPDDFTIAKMFKKKGYNTACFGKWHLGWDFEAIRKPGVSNKDRVKAESYDWSMRFPDGPLDQGFDRYHRDGTINFPPYCWINNDRFETIPTKPVIKSTPLAGGGNFRMGPMAEGWNPYAILPTMTVKTVEYIGEQSNNKPFFIYLAFNSPHYPIVPNKAFHEMSKAGYYGDFVIETDAMVGKVLDALDKHGFSENTIVVFSADNGAEIHAFDRLKEFDQWSSGPLRGVKSDLYEGGHRVPFIVRWPKQIEAGAVSDEVVSQVDLAKTFATVIDYKLQEDEAIDSYNLLPVLKGESYTKPLRKATVQNTHKGKYALRQGDWVLIDTANGAAKKRDKHYLDKFVLEAYPKDNPGLLFNLKNDLRQSKNLYAQYPEKVEQMRALLKRYVDGERCAPYEK